MAVSGWKKGNSFFFEEDYVKMELNRTDGNNMYTILDLDDYEIVRDFPYTWHAAYDKWINGYYCAAVTYFKDDKGKRHQSTVSLHSFLMGTIGRKDIRADHINRNPLDNRRENLRVIDVAANAKNRKGPNKNNISGYRNVAFVDGKWNVQLQIDGRNRVLGRFDNVGEAGEYADKMRRKYYGEYAGAS